MVSYAIYPDKYPDESLIDLSERLRAKQGARLAPDHQSAQTAATSTPLTARHAVYKAQAARLNEAEKSSALAGPARAAGIADPVGIPEAVPPANMGRPCNEG